MMDFIKQDKVAVHSTEFPNFNFQIPNKFKILIFKFKTFDFSNLVFVCDLGFVNWCFRAVRGSGFYIS